VDGKQVNKNWKSIVSFVRKADLKAKRSRYFIIQNRILFDDDVENAVAHIAHLEKLSVEHCKQYKVYEFDYFFKLSSKYLNKPIAQLKEKFNFSKYCEKFDEKYKELFYKPKGVSLSARHK
jgi:hypothetical protein